MAGDRREPVEVRERRHRERGRDEGDSGERTLHRDARGDGRAERIAERGEGRARRKDRDEVIERGAEIVLLATALVVGTGGRADAAKVEAERRQARVDARFRGPHDDGILHVAAIEGMRMTQCDAARHARGNREPSVQLDARSRGEGDPTLGYHGRMRITAGWGAVQPTC